jgi:hypothetical protein
MFAVNALQTIAATIPMSAVFILSSAIPESRPDNLDEFSLTQFDGKWNCATQSYGFSRSQTSSYASNPGALSKVIGQSFPGMV